MSDTGVAGPAPGWGTSPGEACTPAAGWAVIWSCPPPPTGDFLQQNVSITDFSTFGQIIEEKGRKILN